MKNNKSRSSRNAARTALGCMLRGNADRGANISMWHYWRGRDMARKAHAKKSAA